LLIVNIVDAVESHIFLFMPQLRHLPTTRSSDKWRLPEMSPVPL